MSGFKNGSIVLNEERNIYYAGQVLSGTIEFGISQPLVFKAINIEYHGEATVQWEETEVEEYDGLRQQVNIEYGANEEYFNIVQCICGGVGVSQLPAGSHSIPFSFQIPPTVPSSFSDDDDLGGIYYSIKAVLEYPDQEEKDVLETEFEVVVPLDLNINPEMKQLIVFEFEEVLGSCLCGSGPISVQIQLPATGYCPGQRIPIEVTADNQSSVEITKMMFELVSRKKFHSTHPLSDRVPPEEEMAILKKGPILSKTKRNFTCYIDVPEIIVPVLENCRIIDIGYFFKVKLRISGCNDDLEDEAEICLGMIPLVEFSENYSHPLQSDLPQGPIPHPNKPAELIQPYLYPSVTLETRMQYMHINNVTSAYPGHIQPNANATPYPTQGQYPYSGPNAPYPHVNTADTYATPPYPGIIPPYPAQPPYPSNPPAFAPNNIEIGFINPASPGYPTNAMPVLQTSSPYNPSAPPGP